MTKLISFIGYWLGLAVLAAWSGSFAWLLLNWRFDLGWWVWFLISAVGIMIARSGLLLDNLNKDLTARIK